MTLRDDLAREDSRPGFRIWVDGTQHPIHDDPSGLSARLLEDDGAVAEVQVARNGRELLVILAGDAVVTEDRRGNTMVRVFPLKPRSPNGL